MENVTDNRGIPTMYFYKLVSVTKLFCQREKDQLSFDFLKSCLVAFDTWSHEGPVLPIYFQNSVSMSLCFALSFQSQML